jgi:FtsH-binding integral membrane protein
VRIWLKDSERRPDPEPVETDDRKAMLVGMVVWAIALVVVLLLIEPLTAAGYLWWLWTAIAGLALGLIGLLYTHQRRVKGRAGSKGSS